MLLEEFNTATPQQAAELVRACADVDRWVEAVVAGRPYGEVEDAVTAAETLAHPWTDAEIDSALAHHPRIGERASGAEPEAQHSRREQASVAQASVDVKEQLAAGNRAYEERFGHVFLIRAAGRSPAEILEQLQRRLQHTPERERALAADNLREIAARRLRGMLT